MSKRTVLVFPDYCSSGLWLEHINIEPSEVAMSEGLQIALKYWHEVWEFSIADHVEGSTSKCSQRYINRWAEDGRKLAALMSAENDKYFFVYKG